MKKLSNPLYFGIMCLLLGMVSGYVSGSGDEWYQNLQKPSFNPPSYVFAPVWSILYIMMGVALGYLYNNKKKNKFLIKIFKIQLVLNLIWSPLFFYFHRIDLALIDIIMLWLFLALFIAFCFKKRETKSAWLCVPYFLWVSFAVSLNYSLYRLNIS